MLDILTTTGGRKIAYECLGDGPPLVLIHGGYLDRSAWSLLVPLLTDHFTTYAVDRLGHGDSDSYPPHPTISDEAEAIAEIVETIGQPVYLVGHSLGAWVTLEAARRTSSRVRKLALYEPAPVGVPPRPDTLWQLQEAAAAHDREQLAWVGVAGVVGDATGERPPLEALKQSPIWPLLYRNALSIPAELQALWAYHFEPHQYDAFTVPTVLFLGTASRGGIVQTQLEALHRALPTSVVEYLQGQGHGAIFEGPALFATRLIEFWVR